MSTNNPAAVIRPRSRLRYVWISSLALLIVAVGVVGWIVYSDIATCLRAERNLHAIRLTIRVVEQFVHDKGRWPRSWEEMEQQPLPSATPSPLNVGYRESEGWPALSKHLQECVVIDFEADPEQIVRQDPATFDAIKPIGPCYEYQDYGFIQSLQETLRKAISKDQVPAKVEELLKTSGFRLTPHSQVPEEIDRGMMLDAKMHELEIPQGFKESIQVSPQAPPSLKEIRPSPSP